MSKALLVALVLVLAGCGSPEADVEADAAADALAFATPPPSADTPPTTFSVEVREVIDAGPVVSHPDRVSSNPDAQGTWVGLLVAWETTGTEPEHPYSNLLRAMVTDGTSSWNVDVGASQALSAIEGTDDPAENVGPTFTAEFYVAADVPVGTEVTGLVIGGFEYPLE